jgi:hypothetical protein
VVEEAAGRRTAERSEAEAVTAEYTEAGAAAVAQFITPLLVQAGAEATALRDSLL